MTPKQFLQFAQILPDPLLLVTNTGEILMVNRAVTTLLSVPRSKLIGQILVDLVSDSEEKLKEYLRACSQSRQMILGTLMFSSHSGKEIDCRSRGAVVQPRSAESPAILLLRLEKRSGSKFLIHALNKEIQQRQRIQSELAKSNEALKQTLTKLQTALDAVQTEKMSGLGQLVAGIAHEINNPISFIHGNLPHAKDYYDDLLALIHLYQQEYPQPSSAIQDKIVELDFDFLEQDIDKLLHSMQTGSNRVKEIVKSLRNFSRLDEAEFKEVDIHEGLDATLMLLQNRLSASDRNCNIEVIKNYGKLPLIHCSASAINQVFINLLNNAIDALREDKKKRSLTEK
ncbi:MAG: PAS domain-containing sensor histidine kinase, partial [Okeania sp. SIO2H7]|nr:PAS domain-containing sensor histidine kinase [Okeania sp. SIO2H7]